MELSQIRLYAKKLADAIHTDDPLPVSCLSQDRVDQLSDPTALEDIFSIVEATASQKDVALHLLMP